MSSISDDWNMVIGLSIAIGIVLISILGLLTTMNDSWLVGIKIGAVMFFGSIVLRILVFFNKQETKKVKS